MSLLWSFICTTLGSYIKKNSELLQKCEIYASMTYRQAGDTDATSREKKSNSNTSQLETDPSKTVALQYIQLTRLMVNHFEMKSQALLSPSSTQYRNSLMTVVEVVPLVAGAAPVIVRGSVVGAVVSILGLLVESTSLGVLNERLGVQVGRLLAVENSAHLGDSRMLIDVAKPAIYVHYLDCEDVKSRRLEESFTIFLEHLKMIFFSQYTSTDRYFNCPFSKPHHHRRLVTMRFSMLFQWCSSCLNRLELPIFFYE